MEECYTICINNRVILFEHFPLMSKTILHTQKKNNFLCISTHSESVFMFSVVVFLAFDLSVLRGHWFFSSPPQWPMTSDFKGFSIPDFIHYIYFPILIEKEPVFPF